MATLEKIEEANIWIPDGEILKRYRHKLNKMVVKLAKEYIATEGEIPQFILDYTDKQGLDLSERIDTSPVSADTDAESPSE